MREERDEEREGGEESEYMSKFSLIPRPLIGETAWYLQLTIYTNSLHPGKLLGCFFIVFFLFLFLMNDLGTIKARVPYMYFFDQTSRLLHVFISLLVLCGYYSRAATTMYLRAAFISLESFEMSTTA